MHFWLRPGKIIEPNHRELMEPFGNHNKLVSKMSRSFSYRYQRIKMSPSPGSSSLSNISLFQPVTRESLETRALIRVWDALHWRDKCMSHLIDRQ